MRKQSTKMLETKFYMHTTCHNFLKNEKILKKLEQPSGVNNTYIYKWILFFMLCTY